MPSPPDFKKALRTMPDGSDINEAPYWLIENGAAVKVALEALQPVEQVVETWLPPEEEGGEPVLLGKRVETLPQYEVIEFSSDELIAYLQGPCLDNICECVGAPKEYNDGKARMRDFIFRKLAQYSEGVSTISYNTGKGAAFRRGFLTGIERVMEAVQCEEAQGEELRKELMQRLMDLRPADRAARTVDHSITPPKTRERPWRYFMTLYLPIAEGDWLGEQCREKECSITDFITGLVLDARRYGNDGIA